MPLVPIRRAAQRLASRDLIPLDVPPSRQRARDGDIDPGQRPVVDPEVVDLGPVETAWVRRSGSLTSFPGRCLAGGLFPVQMSSRIGSAVAGRIETGRSALSRMTAWGSMPRLW